MLIIRSLTCCQKARGRLFEVICEAVFKTILVGIVAVILAVMIATVLWIYPANAAEEKGKTNDQSVNNQHVNNQSVNDQHVNNQGVNDQSVNDQHVNNHGVNDQSVNDQNVKEAVSRFQSDKKGSDTMKQQITKYELPPLPYDYNELEPYYDAETLHLHHDKHHAAYVNGLNLAEEKLAEAREKGDYSLISYWEHSMAFNGSGHLLHSIFWTNMAPNQSETPRMPSGKLADQITHDFSSYDAFKKQFSSAAISVEGNGWAILGWMPEFNKLVVLQDENHQKQTLWGVKPLLVVDVWEHSYYLRYQNRRAEWIENWWHVVNWDDVAKRFDNACK